MNSVTLVQARTCRTCKQKFTTNHDDACSFHPESYAGETAQRWMAPGETKGAGEIHFFFSCCRGTLESAGCCRRRHLTFDDPDDYTQLRPGMHQNYELEIRLESMNEKVHELTLNEHTATNEK